MATHCAGSFWREYFGGRTDISAKNLAEEVSQSLTFVAQLCLEWRHSRFPAANEGSDPVDARRLTWEGRHKAFHAWLNLIERQQRRPLGWLRADERRFSGLGFPEIPEHHHGLLIDTDGLVCHNAEGLWRAKYGDALVKPYIPNGGALRYCLKHALYNGQ